MIEMKRGSSIICVCLCVYSGNSESGTFSLGLVSSVYGEQWGTTLPERKASFPSPNPLPSPRRRGTLCLQFVFSTQCCVNTRGAALVCECMCMGVLRIIRTHKTKASRQTNRRQMSQNISQLCGNRPFLWRSCYKMTQRGSSFMENTLRWPPPLLGFPSPACQQRWKRELGRKLGGDSFLLTLSLSPSLPVGRPLLLLNYIQIRLLMKSVWF